MKLFIFIICLLVFVQTSFVPLNLCLILLICRSYASPQKSNYYLALIAGILLGILTAFNIGFYALIFVITVFLMHSLRQLPITGKFITIFPATLTALIVVMWIENLVYHLPHNWWYPMWGSILALPIFFVIREWEDRFIVKTGIKLRV
jgi:cell shape-determining protein MreD